MGSTNPLKDLPQKSQVQFKEALKCFETREYKNGLKATEFILKKTPTHGESLSLRGLFLFNLGKKEEGYASVKDGLKQNIKSSINKKYIDAIRCYQQALNIDPENIQIYRDLAVLQTQTRRFSELVQTRELLYKHSNKDFIPSIGLIISYRLDGQYLKAARCLEKYLDSISKQELDTNIISELHLFKANLLELGGKNEEALNTLDTNYSQICDKQVLKNSQARILLKLGRLEESQQAYLELLDLNCDNAEYVVGYLKSCSLDIDMNLFYFSKKSKTFFAESSAPIHSEPLLSAIEELNQRYPDSHFLITLPLYFSTGDKFKELAQNVMKLYFTKGVPSLFNSLKSLYINFSSNFDPKRGSILNEVAENFSASLKSSNRFPDSEEEQSKEVYIWAEFYCVQYLDLNGEYNKALNRLDALIDLDDSIIEIQMFKAKLYKHMGDFSLAETTMNKVRNMEPNDRFLNAKTVKYMFRNNNIKQAEDTFAIFIRNDTTDKQQEILDLQVSWYMLERARSYTRKRKNARALLCYENILTFFNEYYDDQLDFHSYCMRKGTISSYFEMVSWGDNLYSSNPIYQTASSEYVQNLCVLHDKNMKAFGDSLPKPKAPAQSKNPSAPVSVPETDKSEKPELLDEAAKSTVYIDSKNPLEFAKPVLDIWLKHNVTSAAVLNAQFEAYIRLENSLDKALNSLVAACDKSITPTVLVNYIRLKELTKHANKNSAVDTSYVLAKLTEHYSTQIDFTKPNVEILTQLSQSTIGNKAQNILAASIGLEKIAHIDTNNKLVLLKKSVDLLYNFVSGFESSGSLGTKDLKLAYLLDIKEVYSKIIENIPKPKTKSKNKSKTEVTNANDTKAQNPENGDKSPNNEYSCLQDTYQEFLESARRLYPHSKTF
ncbi:hypothetical protein BB561_001847 [Smittium simulii]|uniref:Uncharacterized protein n=1 Tax=Smittium simulii TaxID=133385 RepID=A0A2T9YSR3_9FUNG|nr:hypothetical protein BB561_001847 [Smittium simulii]